MKKILLTLITSILTIAVYAQQEPAYIQPIGNAAIVFFPDTPRISTIDQGLTYEVTKNGVIYAASISSVKLSGLDFFYKNFEESFYRGVLKGFAKSIHGKILYKKDIVIDGIKGIEYEGQGTFDSTTYYIVYHSFYTNKKLISQGMWFKEPVTQNDARVNAFFSTFKFTNQARNNSVWSDKTLVIKGVKYALIIILLITLAVGSIIFIARRSTAKKIKNE